MAFLCLSTRRKRKAAGAGKFKGMKSVQNTEMFFVSKILVLIFLSIHYVILSSQPKVV